MIKIIKEVKPTMSLLDVLSTCKINEIFTCVDNGYEYLIVCGYSLASNCRYYKTSSSSIGVLCLTTGNFGMLDDESSFYTYRFTKYGKLSFD